MERGYRNWRQQAILAFALALTAAGAAACLKPTVPGHQVRGVPAGFLFTANANSGAPTFPDRELLSRGVWLGDIETFEPQSQIHVERYAGRVTRAEAEAARSVQASRYGNPSSITYAPLETVTLDGQSAFAWMETRYDEHDAVRSLEYTAYIPYDTVSYVVAFGTAAPRRLYPDSLTTVVQSWGPGKTEVLWGAILVAAGILGGLAALLFWRARR